MDHSRYDLLPLYFSDFLNRPVILTNNSKCINFSKRKCKFSTTKDYFTMVYLLVKTI
ncbi:hypothetical protein DICPUDRAFT_155524 [Dictyostelium purpureum]|uniref:Uncharacterized protein n=1 Tax=Dictyostelium purpureum TaxID=5786 RepID=F0ZU82_DICPU|nr:uncharacterized protein DICPUDRAFT_155524 [Dictyostelium purpureum]EGC32495.1 hypothetical protein DICPUDRAFT_155524 [Dictyostelium purpureum]|eukprot:XP_003290988.1 hypothetical protein DICPUDRAFT_155524 [Dictyostelium purpureum]